ncbi:MAG: DUF4038 domain-containing protein [Bryobacteraceae bacterium]|nr:DUF4038 domain-containing protein [Bryobacteraceae bacterium]
MWRYSLGLLLLSSALAVERFDLIEVSLKPVAAAANPFTDRKAVGRFWREGVAAPIEVEGFCDAQDGSIYRVRFMPRETGRYRYEVTLDSGEKQTGRFEVTAGKRDGPVRVDPQYPWHFVHEGSAKHYFWNSTTAYALMGWKDDAQVVRILDRFAKLGLNRIRVGIVPPRVESGKQWFEPKVVETPEFTFRTNAWVARRPDSLNDPGFDVTRFNVPYWQRWDRMLRAARDRGIQVSVIFYVDGRLPGVDPFRKERMGGEDEQRYYRYAIARFSAFSNVMWDVTNEYRLFRDDAWAEKMGAFIKQHDPYGHLISIHGHGTFTFRKSPWADYAMYQSWDEHGGYSFMLKNRQLQQQAGRPIPQVNEEYGYEDHYPVGWGGDRKAPARSAGNRRRLAWEMTMAGAYQTTGERADFGGGWINGWGDGRMTLLEGHRRLKEFFESLEWWKMEPRPQGVTGKGHLLAEPGRQYVVYLPDGGSVDVELEDGSYRAELYNPRTGERRALGAVKGGKWKTPRLADGEDWAIVLRR